MARSRRALVAYRKSWVIIRWNQGLSRVNANLIEPPVASLKRISCDWAKKRLLISWQN
jgi:hypothetical protein